MIKAIIYNEWRRLAASIMWLTLGTIVLWSVYWLCKSSMSKSLAEIFETGLLLFLPLLYALMLGAELFSRDINRQTTGFLFSLPISPSRLFWTRYLANFLPVLALTAFNTFLWVLVTGSIYEPLVNIWPLITLQILLLFNVHAMIILCSVLGRGIGGTLGGLGILVILLLQALIWPQIFPLGNAYYHMLFILGIIWLVLLALSWYLWAWRRACGRSLATPLIYLTAGYVIITLLTYIVVWITAERSLQQTLREAAASGIPMTPVPLNMPCPTAGAINAVPILTQLRQETQSKQLSISSKLASRFVNTPTPITPVVLASLRYELCHHYQCLNKPEFCQPWETALTQLRNATVLLPETTSHYADGAPVLPENPVLYALGDYLTYQAMQAAFGAHYQEFFRRLEQLNKLSGLCVPYDSLNPFGETPFRDRQLRLAIICGPLTPDAAIAYRQLLAVAACVMIPPPLPVAQIRSRHLQGHSSFWAIALHPWNVNNFNHDLLAMLTANKLLNPLHAQAELRAYVDKTNRRYRDGRIYRYLAKRTYADAARLALSLKIYRIEHGRFPSKLSELVPSILPEIPLVALTGEPFAYVCANGGFTIFANTHNYYSYCPLAQETVK